MAEGKQIVDTMAGGRIIKVIGSQDEETVFKYSAKDEVHVKDGAKVVNGEALITRKGGEKVLAARSGVITVKKNSVILIGKIQKETEYIIPPGFVLYVKTGDQVLPGDPLTEGNLDLQELFRYKGRAAVQKYMMEEIQTIYSSQGQKLNEKHLEVIIRQMFSRVYVTDAGDTELLPGEIVERGVFEEENERVLAFKQKEAKADELFLGITKVSLSTESFLSAASFQETAKVLINAAVSGRVDHLEGLKENIIIGRLIPAGTGFALPGQALKTVDEIVSPSQLP